MPLRLRIFGWPLDGCGGIHPTALWRDACSMSIRVSASLFLLLLGEREDEGTERECSGPQPFWLTESSSGLFRVASAAIFPREQLIPPAELSREGTWGPHCLGLEFRTRVLPVEQGRGIKERRNSPAIVYNTPINFILLIASSFPPTRSKAANLCLIINWSGSIC